MGKKSRLESRLANIPQTGIADALAASVPPEKKPVAELSAWLMQKEAPTKGKKSELLARSV